MDYRRAFRSAAVSFADLVARVPTERWNDPGLGGWTLRELIGHAAGSGLGQVPGVLATRTEEIARASSEDYWIVARLETPETAATGEDPAALAGLATQALGRVEDDDLVETPAGGMRVRDWIPTRTFELVVHGLDIAAAARIEMHLDPEVFAQAAAQAARAVAMAGQGPELLRALTGRAPLPATITML
jgi:hypothetical protein